MLATSTNDQNVVNKITLEILNSKLSPCIQAIPNAQSSYIWNDKIESDKEYIINIKTIKKNIHLIKNIIYDLHNYDIPEIVITKINLSSSDYKDWFLNSLND